MMRGNRASWKEVTGRDIIDFDVIVIPLRQPIQRMAAGNCSDIDCPLVEAPRNLNPAKIGTLLSL